MEYGKQVCERLKKVRKQIADANGIPYEISECKHQGECAGTCPKCESELRYIEDQLTLRRASGKAVSVVGLALGVAAGMVSCTTSCSPIRTAGYMMPRTVGDVPYMADSTEVEQCTAPIDSTAENAIDKLIEGSEDPVLMGDVLTETVKPTQE